MSELNEHQVGAAKIEGAYDAFNANDLTVKDVLEACAIAHAALTRTVGGDATAQMCARVLEEWVAKNEAANPGALRRGVLASLGLFRANLISD
jgi:hypothetical protein